MNEIERRRVKIKGKESKENETRDRAQTKPGRSIKFLLRIRCLGGVLK